MNAPLPASLDVTATRIAPPRLAGRATTLARPRVAGEEMNRARQPGVSTLAGATIQANEGPRWLMPVTVCELPGGCDASLAPPSFDGHIVEWHLSTATVHRVLPSGHIVETLPANGFLLRPMGAALSVKASAPARFAHFLISDAFLRAVAVDWLGESADCDGLLCCERLMRSDPKVVAMLDLYLRRAMDEEEVPTRLEMDSRAHLIVLQILRRHSVLVEGQHRMRRGGLAPYQLKKACDLMTRNLAEEIPLSVLADKVGVSYHHFCHAFKVSTGQPPRQWLVERRVEAACELLRSTRLTVAEVAAAVGYEDQNQLLRVFRSRRGTTPGAYRREFQDLGAAIAVAA